MAVVKPMMACGHAANATCSRTGGVEYDPPIPSCAICSCHEVAAAVPDLTGRLARCSYQLTHSKDMKPPVPSSLSLAFFEYRGPGSATATHCRHCGYTSDAHDPEYMETLVHVGGRRRSTVVEDGRCTGYKPLSEGQEFDSYYCGCRGWN